MCLVDSLLYACCSKVLSCENRRPTKQIMSKINTLPVQKNKIIYIRNLTGLDFIKKFAFQIPGKTRYSEVNWFRKVHWLPEKRAWPERKPECRHPFQRATLSISPVTRCSSLCFTIWNPSRDNSNLHMSQVIISSVSITILRDNDDKTHEKGALRWTISLWLNWSGMYFFSIWQGPLCLGLFLIRHTSIDYQFYLTQNASLAPIKIIKECINSCCIMLKPHD